MLQAAANCDSNKVTRCTCAIKAIAKRIQCKPAHGQDPSLTTPLNGTQNSAEAPKANLKIQNQQRRPTMQTSSQPTTLPQAPPWAQVN